MSNLMQFLGGGAKVPKAFSRNVLRMDPGITNGHNAFLDAAYDFGNRGNYVLSGACTANTLKTILSITGAGTISFLALAHVDATSRSSRVKITVDGVVVFDATSGASANNSMAVELIGAAQAISRFDAQNYSYRIHEHDIDFNQSLLVEYATSITETDKTRFGYVYYTR